jgi:hypothetical protein
VGFARFVAVEKWVDFDSIECLTIALTNQRRNGYARAQIIADAHCRGCRRFPADLRPDAIQKRASRNLIGREVAFPVDSEVARLALVI